MHLPLNLVGKCVRERYITLGQPTRLIRICDMCERERVYITSCQPTRLIKICDIMPTKIKFCVFDYHIVVCPTADLERQCLALDTNYRCLLPHFFSCAVSCNQVCRCCCLHCSAVEQAVCCLMQDITTDQQCLRLIHRVVRNRPVSSCHSFRKNCVQQLSPLSRNRVVRKCSPLASSSCRPAGVPALQRHSKSLLKSGCGPHAVHLGARRRRSYVQPASPSDEATGEEQPDIAERGSSLTSSGSLTSNHNGSLAALSPEGDRAQSGPKASNSIPCEVAVAANSTIVPDGLHRQPAVSPVVDEYFQIVGTAVLWTGELLLQFLRTPLLPRGNQLMDLRLAAHMDPTNPDK